MQNTPQPGQIYRHFKGNIYRIVTLAEHSETGETLVVYQALYGDYKVYARPLSMFMEKVDKDKYPGAGGEFRFTLQKELIEAPGTEKAAEESVRMSVQEEAEESARISIQEEAGESARTSVQEEAGESTQISAQEEKVEEPPENAGEELNLDPLLIEFLDADSCEKRLNILSALRDRVTDNMINIMAISVGVEIKEGDVERRYDELRSCLLTFGKYESSRLR